MIDRVKKFVVLWILVLAMMLLGQGRVLMAVDPGEPCNDGSAETCAEERQQAQGDKPADPNDDDDDNLQVVEEDDADAGDDDEEESIPLEKTPKAVQATIKKEFGAGAEIEEIHREEDDGQELYYVGGETSGGEFIELTISGEGQVLAREQEIELQRAPKAVQAAVKKAAGDTDLEDVEGRKVVEEGETHFVFEFETSDGSGVELVMTEDGTILVREQEIDPENLPTNIQKLVKVKVGQTAEIEEARKIEEGDEGAFFVVTGQVGDKEFEMSVSVDGSEVEVEIFTEDDEDDEDDEGDEGDDEESDDDDGDSD